MVDQEVENTLREIRERVFAESAQAAGPLAAQPDGPAANGVHAVQAAQANGHAPGEALARLQANLATTERAWSRLPPLVSYRSGLAARLELWVKRQIKRAVHWFTWEQVNFNSAVHHALGDARETLAAHERALASQEQTAARVQADIAALSASFGQLRAESDSERARLSQLQARLAAAESRFDGALAQLRHALAAGVEQLRAEQHALAEETRVEQQAFAEGIHTDQRALVEGLRDEQRAQIQARAAELEKEMRERAERLLEEQRVCFKQLSLEAGEAAVMHDRARRQIEARLEVLEQSRER